MRFIIALLAVLVLIGLAIEYWIWTIVIILLAPLPFVIRHIRMKRYFSSEEFLNHKKEIASIVAEHNEVADYVNEIRQKGRFQIGQSKTGSNSHLATTTNTSKFKFKRDRNVVDYSSPNVHNASLQVVRNAAGDPIKYIIKYFDISATEEKLDEVESLGESISKLENAIQNIQDRESSISTAINPPKFILKHYLEEFQSQIGLSIPQITVPYPIYKFQYVSAGGNSSQETSVKLDSPTIDTLIETLSEKIRFKKSAAGQRALMTAKFREYIKSRDKFSCQLCAISINDEAHLLLEVDHIKPVSKGGLSVEENLQTLCWKCNRSKSNKE